MFMCDCDIIMNVPEAVAMASYDKRITEINAAKVRPSFMTPQSGYGKYGKFGRENYAFGGETYDEFNWQEGKYGNYDRSEAYCKTAPTKTSPTKPSTPAIPERSATESLNAIEKFVKLLLGVDKVQDFQIAMNQAELMFEGYDESGIDDSFTKTFIENGNIDSFDIEFFRCYKQATGNYLFKNEASIGKFKFFLDDVTTHIDVFNRKYAWKYRTLSSLDSWIEDFVNIDRRIN